MALELGGVSPASPACPLASLELVPHQAAALPRAQRLICELGGVLIADATGLGKTRLALALALWARDRGETPILVAPASLRDMWDREARRVSLDLPFYSHSWLGRRENTPELSEEGLLVIVDEAHGFRNPRSNRYRTLASMMRRNRAVLLTATPVNNSLMDLYHQIRLFARPDRLRALGLPDLERLFLEADREGDPEALSRLVQHVVIRRGRDALGPRAFPRRRLVSIPLPLEAAYGGRFHRLVDGIESLSPGRWGLACPGALVSLLLLKRFSSSPAALLASLSRMRALLKVSLEVRGETGSRRLDLRLLRRRVEADLHDEGFQGRLFPPEAAPAERTTSAGPWCPQTATTDLATLADLIEAVRELAGGADPKLKALGDYLGMPLRGGSLCPPPRQGDVLGGRKLLVFTEYRHTLAQLERAFRHVARVGVLDGERARAGGRTVPREDLLQRFAPHALGLSAPPPPYEQIQVLLATDVLSHGQNLQDAQVLVNYDLPWNPVRLVQRAGRIDRLGSTHHEVELAHFEPGEPFERVLRLVSRLEKKLAAIGSSVGLDRPVMGRSGAESPEASVLEPKRTPGLPRETDLHERAALLVARLTGEDEDLLLRARSLPEGLVSAAEDRASSVRRVLLLYRERSGGGGGIGPRQRAVLLTSRGPGEPRVCELPPKALEHLAGAPGLRPCLPSGGRTLRRDDEYARAWLAGDLDRERAARLKPAALRRACPARRLHRWLMSWLRRHRDGALAGSPSAGDTIGRVERILAALSQPQPPGVESSLAELAQLVNGPVADPGPPEDLLAALEARLAVPVLPLGPARARPSSSASMLILVAALELLPARALHPQEVETEEITENTERRRGM